MELTPNMKTKITNVDVVNRSLDRSQMTIGVEFNYRDRFGSNPKLGVDVYRNDDPRVSQFFQSNPTEIGRSRRNFMLFPVKFEPPSASSSSFGSFATDKVLVYLTDDGNEERANLFPATMLLTWRAPGADSGGPAAQGAGASLTLDDFKQNDLFSGYVTVRYQANANSWIRLKILDSNNPASAEWFESVPEPVKRGRGLQLLRVRVFEDANSPSDLIKADTIIVELIDSGERVLDRLEHKVSMDWARPKD